MSLKIPSSHPEMFFSNTYQCSKCEYTSEIFLSLDYSLYNICNSNSICANCGTRKPTVCNGDMILRRDWPDADNDSWQMQCAYIPEENGCCEDCAHSFTGDYKMLMIACPVCEDKWMVHKT